MHMRRVLHGVGRAARRHQSSLAPRPSSSRGSARTARKPAASRLCWRAAARAGLALANNSGVATEPADVRAMPISRATRDVPY